MYIQIGPTEPVILRRRARTQSSAETCLTIFMLYFVAAPSRHIHRRKSHTYRSHRLEHSFGRNGWRMNGARRPATGFVCCLAFQVFQWSASVSNKQMRRKQNKMRKNGMGVGGLGGRIGVRRFKDWANAFRFIDGIDFAATIVAATDAVSLFCVRFCFHFGRRLSASPIWRTF